MKYYYIESRVYFPFAVSHNCRQLTNIIVANLRKHYITGNFLRFSQRWL
jgi:hypothetical protein